jgi:predicted outer membrane repeat protein
MAPKSVAVLVLILALSAPAAPATLAASAATITVTSKLDTADPGKCRLRDAILAANNNVANGSCPAGTLGLDTISFSLGLACTLTPCTIALQSALPLVTEALTINGNGAGVSGENAFRVFDLGPVPVSISNLRIANGKVTSDTGGGIRMSAAASTTLTVTNVFFSGNHANLGGAIHQPLGTLTVSHSNFSGNTAATSGGAIFQEQNASTIAVTDTRFISNSAESTAGGAMLLASEASIAGSTFSSNSAPDGGAISKRTHGSFLVSDTLFDHNAATFRLGGSGGGAMYVFTGTATLTNVTMSGNSAEYRGGALFAVLTSITLNNVTITGNTADSEPNSGGDGGGIFEEDSTIRVQNSIIAANFDTPGNAGPGTIHPDCSGTFLSFGYNLIGRNDGCIGFVNGVNGDKVGSGSSPIDPLLAPLADQGGPTLTHALLPGSPAFNAGDPLPPGSGGIACAAADQRGITRPQADVCDIGAFELELELLRLYLPLLLR